MAATNFWEDAIAFEKRHQNIKLITSYTTGTLKPENTSVPYIRSRMECKNKNPPEEAKIKTVSLVYFHANAQTIYVAFDMMLCVLENLQPRLFENHKEYSVIYVEVICFEYPYYYYGNTSNYNTDILASWDSVVNNELKKIFNINIPGIPRQHESFYNYEQSTGNSIIYIGMSIGSGFLCRQLVFDTPSKFILLAPIPCVKKLAKRESKRLMMGNMVMNMLWSDKKHEYFPNLKLIEENLTVDKKMYILMSDMDELCGDFNQHFRDLPNHGSITIVETDYYHSGFASADGLELLSDIIYDIIQ